MAIMINSMGGTTQKVISPINAFVIIPPRYGGTTKTVSLRKGDYLYLNGQGLNKITITDNDNIRMDCRSGGSISNGMLHIPFYMQHVDVPIYYIKEDGVVSFDHDDTAPYAQSAFVLVLRETSKYNKPTYFDTDTVGLTLETAYTIPSGKIALIQGGGYRVESYAAVPIGAQTFTNDPSSVNSIQFYCQSNYFPITNGAFNSLPDLRSFSTIRFSSTKNCWAFMGEGEILRGGYPGSEAATSEYRIWLYDKIS